MKFSPIFLHKSSSRDEWNRKNKFSGLAGYTPLKYVISGKPLITPEPEVGKFQNWAERKVNYPTNNKITPEDFSDNFHNIKKFVQVDHLGKITKKPPHFFCSPLPKIRRWPENFFNWQK
jgi:hypothetical protein